MNTCSLFKNKSAMKTLQGSERYLLKSLEDWVSTIYLYSLSYLTEDVTKKQTWVMEGGDKMSGGIVKALSRLLVKLSLDMFLFFFLAD